MLHWLVLFPFVPSWASAQQIVQVRNLLPTYSNSEHDLISSRSNSYTAREKPRGKGYKHLAYCLKFLDKNGLELTELSVDIPNHPPAAHIEAHRSLHHPDQERHFFARRRDLPGAVDCNVDGHSVYLML